ncbi:hypothetical protein AN5437.2 [Aspergillus nidulans FGSC A4]|uniref:Subtelomeric hrmA-associated cluster protein AFUB-079030/YDR124W-like helical bundle domain-containing protein n=1 Tax=Emericella nidulans (strain FGSC A4 / ATCC 38163 / CBS 112.46 / NRRL 194 / M139) TaxID=227321 RepID=Q5B1Z3_EMENI|nr:hypothetical protein [Aspergillus nidulans FGSC A4]EAA62597.1 hypothetical protein AN5437.2 [Aspergillus nidulans FGSC A4]CBF81911.1 TPA: conserved hypothetical protein [Aspergillus nidulans FGSC A4]|eukprot:XP_663041.1 hypothetical protein AN5437.2 [Aspergillus nidulans FGSC A4]
MPGCPDSTNRALDSLESQHFALLYIDESGKLRFEASPSIANDAHAILSPEVTHSFLKAVAGSENGARAGSESAAEFRSGRSSSSPDSPVSSFSPRSNTSLPLDGSRKRKRASHEYVLPMSITSYPKTMLPVGNKRILRSYYEKAFECLQQTNCRILAKAYIKLVEPRKQVTYPYNGHKVVAGVPQQFDPEETRPLWWPTGVTHREPDHLRKPERIRLLIHILCELRESHAICVEKLREADQAIRRQISPVERLQVLDEIYRVRGEEERYLDGRSDSRAVVYVSRVHLPEIADAQTSLHPSNDSTALPDGYREDVPDLVHTSVPPSSSLSTSYSLPKRELDTTSNSITSISIPTSNPTVSTTWEAFHPTIPVSATLPPIHSSMQQDGTDHTKMPYALSYPTSPYGYHQPAPALEMQPFAMGYTNINPHLPPQPSQQNDAHHGHPQTHASMSMMRTDTGFGHHPYYFNC